MSKTLREASTQDFYKEKTLKISANYPDFLYKGSTTFGVSAHSWTHTMPCTGKSKGHQRPDVLFLTHYIMRSHFFCTYARVLASAGTGPPQAACVRHVPCVCVVVTERRGGGCAVLSGIALILLNDY
ncbi:uncharacterized protein V6R79_007748 [Siganus canaliculatus]